MQFEVGFQWAQGTMYKMEDPIPLGKAATVFLGGGGMVWPHASIIVTTCYYHAGSIHHDKHTALLWCPAVCPVFS